MAFDRRKMKTAQQEEADAKMKSNIRNFRNSDRPLMFASMMALAATTSVTPKPNNKKHDWD